jgi:hypothetical protein
MFRLTADLEGLNEGMMSIREMTDHSMAIGMILSSSTTYSREEISSLPGTQQIGFIPWVTQLPRDCIRSLSIRSITLVDDTLRPDVPWIGKANAELITNTRWFLKG